jgi:hypothetical protein
MITKLFMGWTDSFTNRWFPIKMLTWENDIYHEICLPGLLEVAKISPRIEGEIERGIHKINEIEVSQEIAGYFGRFVAPYTDYEGIDLISWLTLDGEETPLSTFEYVSRYSRAHLRERQDFDIFPQVAPDKNNVYHFYFGNEPSDGIEIDNYINQLKIGTSLSIANGCIYHEDFLVGQAPGYITDLYKCCPEGFKITIAKINDDRYIIWNLICHVEIEGSKFIPFSDSRYQPLINFKSNKKEIE